MRLDAVRLRVQIGCVFVRVVIESEIVHIYKAVLQTIKIVAQTLSWVSELLAKNHKLTKKDWTYSCYSSEGPN
jgi:cytochrome b subunit of formate dehydrogenase